MKKVLWKSSLSFALTLAMVLGAMPLPQFTRVARAQEAANIPPFVSGIPGESIDEGRKFAPVKLDKYVTDEDKPEKLKWSVSGNKELKVSISPDRVATIEIPNEYWNGSEDITFYATDTKGAVGSETVNFTVRSVNNPPVVGQIPDQTIVEGQTFEKISLDDYVSDPDHLKSEILWKFDISPIGKNQAEGSLRVEMDSDRVATVMIPDQNWYGSARVQFTATDGENASDSKTANFVVKPKEVDYIDENGEGRTVTDYTVITNNIDTPDENGSINLPGGWYVVRNSTTISDRISVSDTVNLILCDGTTLNVEKGITVGSNATFNIYAQSEEEATMGTLIADAASADFAGIGGERDHANFGTIMINGGKITANGGVSSAGIGGGFQSTGGAITINGGIINAAAKKNSCSAGIGGGCNGYVGSVTLNGGIITATGDDCQNEGAGGAGIGAGAGAGSGTMTITIGSGVKKLVAIRGYHSDCIGKETNAATTVNVVFKDGKTPVTGSSKDAVFYDTGEGTGRQIRTKALNHNVSMSDDLKKNIAVIPEYALAGEKVTMTLGEIVDSSTLKATVGTKDLTLTSAGNHRYTFTMPDGNVTVTATLHTHNISYASTDNIITATCLADHCYLTDSKAALIINKPALTTYGGEEEATATLTGLDTFNAATGLNISADNIRYIGRGNTNYAENTKAPTKAGDYTAKITVGGKTASVNYTIAQKSVKVSGVNGTMRDYVPNDRTVALTGGEVSDKVGNDDVSVDLSAASGTMADANAGTDKTVTVTGVRLVGADADNYMLPVQPEDVTVTINRIAYPGTRIASANVYSGQVTTDATLTLPALPEGAEGYGVASITGDLIGKTPTISGRTLTFSTTSRDAGTTGTITLTVPKSTNYESYSFVVTVTATDKEDAGVVINGGELKNVTYGTADFTLISTVTGAGTGTGVWTWESSEPSVAKIDQDTGKITVKKAGSTTIKAKYESDSTIGEASISLTVEPKILGITWTNTSFTYDGQLHVPAAALVGVVGEDNCTVSVLGAQTNAGNDYTAAASISGTDMGNYTLSDETKNCSFTIEKASHEDTTVSAESKYGLKGSVELAAFMEQGGKPDQLTVTDTKAVLKETPIINGAALHYSFVDDAEKTGESAVVEIWVRDCTNYQDYKIITTLNVAACAHERTEIRNAKVATCIARGYTGDIYCLECEKVIKKGEDIPLDPNNHSYDGGVVTKAPTAQEEGIKTYTCIDCGHTYTEPVEKRKEENPASEEKKEEQPKSLAEGTQLTATREKAEVVVTSKEGETPSVEYKKSTDEIAKSVEIPASVTVDGVSYAVTSVADRAFKDNKKLENVKMGNNITMLGKNTFEGCSKLKSVTLSTNITKIPAGTFKDCKALKSIKLDHVKEIGDGAFENCGSLKSFTIGTKVTRIGKKAFKGTKITTLIVKTSKLTKKTIKGALIKSKVKTIKVKAGNKKQNEAVIKKYKKIFTKKITGKKVTVK